MNSKEETLVNQLLAGLEKFFSKYTEKEYQRFWPANPVQMDAYFGVDIVYTIFSEYKINFEKCKEALLKVRPLVLYAALYHIFPSLKIIKQEKLYPISQEEINNFWVFFLEIIRQQIKGELFCLDGTFQKLTVEEAEKLEKRIKWTEAEDQNIKRAVSSLIITAENLIWSFYFDPYTETGSERHGPYQLKDSVLLVREYYDLQPRQIWKTKNKYKNLTMYLKFAPTTKIALTYSNMLETRDPIWDKLVEFYIAVDGKPLRDLKQITELGDYLAEIAQEQSSIVNKLLPLEIIKKATEIYYYQYVNFFKYYHQSWKPPKSLYNYISKEGLSFWNQYKEQKPIKNPKRYYHKLFDMRDDFIN